MVYSQNYKLLKYFTIKTSSNLFYNYRVITFTETNDKTYFLLFSVNVKYRYEQRNMTKPRQYGRIY